MRHLEGVSDSPWRAELGERIHEARKSKGWGWRAAERWSSVPATTWRRAEQGLSVNDRALIGIAAAFGWRPGECFQVMADAVNDKAG